MRKLFEKLIGAGTESEVEEILSTASFLQLRGSWYPLGGNDSNYGVVENQQSSPIAALIEKIINSIDAILMRKAAEAGLDPRSPDAPPSMEDAVKRFFAEDVETWHLGPFRQKQAEDIQIHADGPRMDTSLLIYDNGEGQHPDDFENTFLSLLHGNKNDIPFVQGKYNMGGTGAIVFCGKRGYQLIASRKWTADGDFGFTLVREHPLTDEEAKTKKNTWYEFLKIDGRIPRFPIEALDLGLRGRLFTTGSLVKLYSYDLPSGARSVISRDLNQSINEFLFEPALPVYTIDKAERYPKDKALARELFGLKRRVEADDSKYIEESFSQESVSADIGRMKVTCYVFHSKVDGRTVKETRETIQREFFKNNMAVLFSLNGQVHGHYTSEFITRSLKFPLLKNHLLIHVDCTHMRYAFRKELFMASRDRLKDSAETRQLRHLLTTLLSKGRLKEIYKRRRDFMSLESGDTAELLKSFTKSIPLNSDLLRLLQNTFKIDIPTDKKKGEKPKKKTKDKEEKTPFKPQRFPSFFRLVGSGTEEKPAAKVPLGGLRSVKFATDVEDQYFDRTHEPGDLQISLLSYKPNETTGGNAAGEPKQLSDLMNVTKSSPDQGTIRIAMAPTREVMVDDLVQMKAVLHGPGESFEERFWVKIAEKDKKPEKKQRDEEIKPESLGLPQYFLVWKEPHDGHYTWNSFAEKTSADEMDFSTIMHPLVTGEKLEAIFINMDSRVLKGHKGRIKAISHEQIEVAEKKYISSVYFHTLFLFTIAKNRNYTVRQAENDVDIGDFLKDVFASHYSEFLLNFGTEQLMATLDL